MFAVALLGVAAASWTPAGALTRPRLPVTTPAARSIVCVASPPASTPLADCEDEPSTGLSLGGARTLLAGVAAVYGTNYAAVKSLDEWTGSSAAAATLRFALCVAVLAPCLAAAAHRHPSVVRWPLARDGLEVGFWFALGYVVQACALEHSPAGVQAFLLSLTVVVCPALESLLERTKQPVR
jgi:hypothetical protein